MERVLLPRVLSLAQAAAAANIHLTIDAEETERLELSIALLDSLCARLDALVDLRGRATVQHWQAQARAGDWSDVFGDMVTQHYDPLYNRSMDRHYQGMAQATAVPLARAAALAAARS